MLKELVDGLLWDVTEAESEDEQQFNRKDEGIFGRLHRVYLGLAVLLGIQPVKTCKCMNESLVGGCHVLVSFLITNRHDSHQVVNGRASLHPNDNILVTEVWQFMPVQGSDGDISSTSAEGSNEYNGHNFRYCDVPGHRTVFHCLFDHGGRELAHYSCANPVSLP